MFVCVCKGVTDSQIREAVCEGVCSMRELCSRLGVAAQCGRCAPQARRVFEEALTSESREDNEQAA
jgi:bacterioferritin-associated ferredoxin